MGKHGWVRLAGVVGALALGIGLVAGGAALAQDGDATPSFLDRVAGKLGIDTPKLEQAIKDARNDELDQAVKDGELTQEQADRLKERLDELPADGRIFGGRGGFHRGGPGPKDGLGLDFWFGGPHAGPHGPRGFHFGLGIPGGLMEAQQKLADFLGITPEQLGEEMAADGASLATVAEAHGKSRDDLKTFLLTEIKAKFDAAVAEGHLTQEQADAIQTKLNEHLERMIDAQLRFKMDRLPFDRSPDGETPDSGAEPEGQSQEFESFSIQS